MPDASKPAVAGIIVLVCIVLAGAVAGGAGTHTTTLAGVPVAWVAVALAFAVQWIAFVPAYLRRTEHFYDLTGSVTYLMVVGLTLASAGTESLRSVALTLMVAVWAFRLGIFLFRRVSRAGKDGRFDEIKQSFPRFLVAWTVQGLWVWLTASAAVAAIAAADPAPLGTLDVVGAGLWLTGFAIEVVADLQKSRFKKANPSGFISSGLWSWSRHPNYFGEILLWVGIAVVAASTLQGWQWITMISPVFVAVLLIKISGVPLLEERADERWGGQRDYEDYKAGTPVLVLRPPARTS